MNKELKEQTIKEWKEWYVKTHPLNIDLDSMADFWISKLEQTVQMTEERIVKLIDKFEAEPLLMTTIDSPCICDFDNGDVIRLDEEGKHTKCGKTLNMPVPIKTSIQKLKKSLITNKSDINKE